MKKNIFLSMCASLLLLVSCDYNEENFPGFDELTKPKDVQNVEVSLADGDYKKIATLNTNRELALSKDPEGKTFLTALDAISKNKYFTENAPALWYLPAYIDSIQPYLSDGSKVTVAYKNAENLPAYLADFGNVSTYTLSSDDYKSVWGDEVSAPFLSPSTLGNLSSVLKAAMKKPADGSMRMVNYAYSETEPSIGGGTGGGDEPKPTYTTISDVLKGKAGATYTSKGEVVAVNAKSFMFSDGTGIIRVYRGNLPSCSLGDIVEVSGEIQTSQELNRFRSSATFKVLERKTSFAYPTPKLVTVDNLAAYIKNPDIQYVTYEGVISKNNNNINIDFGNKDIVGSITDPLLVDDTWMGKTVVVTGYLAGVSGGKYINTFATSITLKEAANIITPIGVTALSAAGDYAVQGVVSGLNTRGFMLTDGSGDILVYENKTPTPKIGDIVLVKGTTLSYNGLMQFGNNGLEVTIVGGEGKSVVESMIPQLFTGPDFDSYKTTPRPVYVSFEGTLSIEDSNKGFNYYNIAVDGATAKISFSYVDEAKVSESLNGKKVIVQGYLIGVNKSGYIQVMLTSVKDAVATAKLFGTTRAAVTPNVSALYRYDAASQSWREYTTSAASVAVLQPGDYDKMGGSYISKPTETLPVYLRQNYPYAQKNKTIAVVYYIKNMEIAATEFIYDGANWVETAEAMPATIIFVKNQGIWNEAKIYFAASFADGDDGGFVAQDIELGGKTSIWSLDAKYGYWKGTGYSGGKNKTESWLISPEIDLKKSAAPVVKFDIAVNYLEGADIKNHINLLVSTNYVEGEPNPDDWKVLEIEKWPKGDSWTFSSITADLSAYKDKVIRLAFQYKSDLEATTTVEIKNLSVQE